MLFRILALLASLAFSFAAEAQVRIVAIGDSQIRGKGVPEADAYPAKLERALKAKGHNVVVSNAGINGDTTSGVLARLDHDVPQGTRIAIVSVGANDIVLHNARRAATVNNLKSIVERLRARGVEVLVFGLGGGKTSKLGTPDPNESSLLQAAGATVMPAMQAGLFSDPQMHVEASWQTGTEWHLNAQGYDIVVQRSLPAVEGIVTKVK